MRRLQAAVAGLPDREPPRDEWERITARRRRAAVRLLSPSFVSRVMQPRVLRLAASIVVLFGGGIVVGYGIAHRAAAPNVDLVALAQQLGAVSARSVIGAEVVPLDSTLGARLGGLRQGLLVLRVAAGTPAARLGLHPWDVIAAVNGAPVATVAELRRALATTPRATVAWRRDGAVLEATLAGTSP